MQQVRHTMAEVKTDIVMSRVMTDKLIEAYAMDDMDQQTVSMAKVCSSVSTPTVVDTSESDIHSLKNILYQITNL